MKIGIFTNNYLPNPYGVSSSIESFRKEFEALGHEVFIFAPNWKDFKDTNPHVFRYPSIDITLKFRFPLPIPYSRKMDKILENLDLDIIHSQHPNLLGNAAAKWARKKKIPLVFTWHTLYDQYANFVPFLPKKFVSWWAIRNARIYANKCDQVIVPTNSVKAIIEGWGVTNRHIENIPTGVEEKVFANQNRKLIREKFGVRDDDVLLVLVSRLTEEKNIKFLFNAVCEILQNNMKIKFLVVGDGYLLPELKRLAQALNLSKLIIFAGIVLRENIKNYYAAGDIFVYASKSETQGMIINEAMYAGLPVVAVRATGIEDSVEDGKTGLLVAEDKTEFKVAVKKLITDKNMRQQFSAAAQKIAHEKYTAQVCAQGMLEIYNKAIDNKKL